MTADPIVLDRCELARRLGVARERLVFEILTGGAGKAGETIAFHVLVDGGDLTAREKDVVGAFLAEKLGTVVTFPTGGVA